MGRVMRTMAAYHVECQGHIMEVAHEEFTQCLSELVGVPDGDGAVDGEQLSEGNKTMALLVVWPVLMPEVFNCLTSSDPEERTAGRWMGSGPRSTRACPKARVSVWLFCLPTPL